MNKTDWFEGDTKPVHIGLYEVQSFTGDTSYFMNWTEDGWFWLPYKRAVNQSRIWRGLTEPAQ